MSLILDPLLIPASLPRVLHWLPPLLLASGLHAAFMWPTQAWRIARVAALAAGLAALGVLVAHGVGPAMLDLSQVLMLALVAGLGIVITRYSSRYLEGEAGAGPAARALLAVLASVAVLIVSDHLGVMLAAWILSSLAVDRLIRFDGQRPAAHAAANRKFLTSRVSELLFLGALALIQHGAGTLELSSLTAQVQLAGGLTPPLEAAVLLLVLALVLKSALLPFHGWLIRVMEAPTPVSALLHAGVVNIGGFLLIRLGDLVALLPGAQALLITVGSLTAVLAALAMSAQPTIKGRLAWSTCGQMGFMALEAGLGLYSLALMHLIGHSIYKAHAFLTAGSRVEAARRAALIAPEGDAARPSTAALLMALPLTMLLAALALLPWMLLLPAAVPPPIALLIAGLGWAPLAWAVSRRGLPARWQLGLRWLLTVTGLALGHALLSPWIDDHPAGLSLQGLAALPFVGLFLVSALRHAAPQSPALDRLRRLASAGFHLDPDTSRLRRLSPVRAFRPRDRLTGDAA